MRGWLLSGASKSVNESTRHSTFESAATFAERGAVNDGHFAKGHAGAKPAMRLGCPGLKRDRDARCAGHQKEHCPHLLQLG